MFINNEMILFYSNENRKKKQNEWQVEEFRYIFK